MGGACLVANQQKNSEKNIVFLNSPRKEQIYYCDKNRETYKLPPEVIFCFGEYNSFSKDADVVKSDFNIKKNKDKNK